MGTPLPMSWRGESAWSSLPHRGLSFTHVHWNVLADGLAAPADFPLAPPSALVGSARVALELRMIRDFAPDILAVNELTHVCEFAACLGATHAVTFVPKLDSPALSASGRPDGTAVFIRRERFSIVDVDIVYFYAPPVDDSDAEPVVGNQNGVVLLLRERSGAAAGRLLVVASTHLKAKESAANEAVRDAQCVQLLERIRRMRSRATALLSPASASTVPVLLSGDFNSPPSDSVYARIYSDAELRMHSAHNRFSMQRQDSAGVASAAAAELPLAEYLAAEPELTTWKFRAPGVEKCRTIDYVWFSTDDGGAGLAALRPIDTMALPSRAAIGEAALPSEAFPSDHLCLVTRFSWV